MKSDVQPIIDQIQEVKCGADAMQIGIQNNTYGLTYRDTKELCCNLIKMELDNYKFEAEKIAKLREANLFENFLKRISKEKLDDKKIAEEFENPDMQFTYIAAQKSYMRFGTKELENMLAQLMVDRLKEKERTLLQIALGEAVTVVPLLLPEQIDILALCFKLRYAKNYTVDSLVSFYNYLNGFFLQHLNGEQKKISIYQHLVYTKVGSIEISEIPLEKIFLENYSGLFMKGLDSDKIKLHIAKYPSLFIDCQQNPSKKQINAMDSDSLSKRLVSLNVSLEDKKAIETLFFENMLSYIEIKDTICKAIPQMNDLFEVWNNSKLKNLTLTSVGIVIGAMQSKQISDAEIDLNTWI